MIYGYECEACEQQVELDVEMGRRNDDYPCPCESCEGKLFRLIGYGVATNMGEFKQVEVVGYNDKGPIYSLNGTGPVGDGGIGERTTAVPEGGVGGVGYNAPKFKRKK